MIWRLIRQWWWLPIATVALQAGCSVMAERARENDPPPFKACLALPPEPPVVRTPEQLNDDSKAVRALYRDCAERLRRTVAAWPQP